MVGAQRDADTAVEVQLDAGELERRAQGVSDAAGHALGVRGVRARPQHHGELVAAQPGEHVAGPQHARQPGPDAAQQLVADVVPQRVVDLLEPVEVQQQHGQPVFRPAPVQQLRELVLQQPPVAQAGQLVGQRQAA